MHKLLLFDIDGTILLTRGVGRRAVEEALSVLAGRPVTSSGVTFAGRTDPQIFTDILLQSGVPPREVAALLSEAMRVYADIVRDLLSADAIDLLPGVRALIEELAAHENVQLALLTGNIEVTAYLKMEAAGLAHHFPFGAFGSDHSDRYQLPAIAVQRARQHAGYTYAGKDVVIIGDTEHDIRCGRSLGVFAVGVCTGHYDRAALAPHEPDLLLDDLSNTEAFIHHVLRLAA